MIKKNHGGFFNQCSFKILLYCSGGRMSKHWSQLKYLVVFCCRRCWQSLTQKNSRNGLLHAKGRSAECSLNHPLTKFAADCAIVMNLIPSRETFLGSFVYLQKCPQTISLPNAIKSCPPMQKSVSSWHIAMNLLSFACICQLGGNKYSTKCF